jgi:hypothetical protein
MRLLNRRCQGEEVEANALRLIGEISRNALASGSHSDVPPFDSTILELHSILRFTDVLHDVMQFFFGVDALPVAP